MLKRYCFLNSDSFPSITIPNWKKLHKKISKIAYNRQANEADGVHPRVHGILNECCAISSM